MNPSWLPGTRNISLLLWPTWGMDFPGHFDQIFQQLNSQRLHGQLCDCVIVVGSRHFKAHRSVLAACSTHFRALFTVTEGDGGVNMIQLDSEVVTAEAFSALVDMMYTSTLMLGESNVMDVLLAASHLHLNAVVKACKHYLTTRTLPMSPLAGERAVHHPPDQPQQQCSPAGPATRLQRNYLLQQLGLSLVSSALEGMDETVDAGRAVGATVEQRVTFPIRRVHKRKISSSVITPEDRQRQRLRSFLGPEDPLIVRVGDGEILSPDSLKMGDEAKLEIGGVAEEQKYGQDATQEDAQVPSQSDAGRECERTPPECRPGKEELAEGGVVTVKEISEEEEPLQMRVVVKAEPLSSPEPPDEVSNVTSPAEGSDHVDPATDKIELSPEGSDRSSSDPQSSTDRVGDGSAAREGASEDDGCRGLEGGALLGGDGLDRKQGFSFSNFLCPKGFGEAGSGSTGDDSLPNTTTGACRLDGEAGRFLQSPESVSGPSSSVGHLGSQHPHQHFLSSEQHPFGEVQPNALFLHPVEEGIGFRRLGGEQFPMDHQQSNLALHSLARSTRGGGGGASLGLPHYRRIAPKIPPNEAGYDGSGVDAQSARPQLTRASADVLSKCKKALTEHNVLVVEGARKYACKICCKTFLTLTDCKKHIRVHTGEKPYACLKCGKRFSQSSHLYKHSKTTCLRWQNHNLQSSLL